jgi:hypothetical protein
MYLSTNAGVTWNPTGAPRSGWYSTVASADGTKFAAASSQGGIYTSQDSGATWVRRSATGYQVAGSADGRKLVVANANGTIETSINGGVTWSVLTNIGGAGAIVCSADASRVFAAATRHDDEPSGTLYSSLDWGTTWKELLTIHTKIVWTSLASSADGRNLMAAGNIPNHITADIGPLYVSEDYGETWSLVPQFARGLWSSAAFSADGSKLVVATVGDPAGPDASGLHLHQSAPRPLLKMRFTEGNAVISWIIPSSDFRLQETSSVPNANWIEAPGIQTVNLSNLENEWKLSQQVGRQFYRLKSQ